MKMVQIMKGGKYHEKKRNDEEILCDVTCHYHGND